ncbi:hypothetical protein SAMN05877753_111133 [Bacillus oleivorans]|uniref:Uncharacterized protein n=1 Tax=Bacillus oleivorans TaxID=1448271 RepID=A0A285D640_9BACI|nr:hypothetical protein SAMN05877753_111133 [Bacillus oleivorans]
MCVFKKLMGDFVAFLGALLCYWADLGLFWGAPLCYWADLSLFWARRSVDWAAPGLFWARRSVIGRICHFFGRAALLLGGSVTFLGAPLC